MWYKNESIKEQTWQTKMRYQQMIKVNSNKNERSMLFEVSYSDMLNV